MSQLKKLASQTAIYGLSSTVGRFLNYLLVYLHTLQFSPEQYGIITEMYAYVAFLIIFLTYGMETAYFRFSTRGDYDAQTVFSNALKSVGITTVFFIGICLLGHQGIANAMQYPNHSEYVIWFGLIIGLDVLSSIPMARLRAEDKALKFAGVNLLNIAIFIGLNLFWIAYCKPQYEAGNTNWLIEMGYNPEIGVGYVFIANLIASASKFTFLIPEMLKARGGIDTKLIKKMLVFALPLLIVGLSGNINEMLDRLIMKPLLQKQMGLDAAMAELGIYGANYKISIVIMLFIQAIRYAAEPFYFNQNKGEDSKKLFAKILTYIAAFLSLLFLGVMLNIDLIKYFTPNESYWEGLQIVPILLLANICLGLYYNQSIWYKMTEKTMYGAAISIGGALLTVGLNIWLIPTMGYMGAAWTTLAVYATMLIVSFIVGQRHYPVPYEFGKLFFFIVLALALWLFSFRIGSENLWIEYSYRLLLLAVFVLAFFAVEKPNLKGLRKGA